MRLILTAGRRALLDIEVLLFRRLDDDGDQVLNTHLEDSERSDPMDPDTITFGFGL
jgi:hypothetical protein